MAVATDFHRDFLIPEQVLTCPTTSVKHPMTCVYSFVAFSVSQAKLKVNG